MAGVSTNIVINCDLARQDEAPFWMINGSIYELFSIPHSFLSNGVPVIPTVNSFATITIPQVTTDLSGTVFQCGLFEDNDLVLDARRTRLIVTSSKWLVNFPLSKTWFIINSRWSCRAGKSHYDCCEL